MNIYSITHNGTVDGIWIPSECFFNAIETFLHVIYIVAAVLVWNIYFRSCISQKPKTDYFLRFQGHVFRWIFYLLLLTVLLAALTESIMTGLTFGQDSSRISFNFCAPACTSIVGFFLCVFFSYRMEEAQEKSVIYFCLCHWVTCLVDKAIHLPTLLPKESEVVTLRSNLTIILMCMYCILTVLEVWLILTAQKPIRTECISAELRRSNMRYYAKHCHIYSELTFSWVTWVISLGYKRTLQAKDFGPLLDNLTAQRLQEQFDTLFMEEKTKIQKRGKKPSIWKVFWLMKGRLWLAGTALKLTSDVLSCLSPMCVALLVRYVNAIDSHVNKGPHFTRTLEFFQNGFVVMIMMIMCIITQQLMEQTCRYWHKKIGVCLMISLFASTYRKFLNVSSTVFSKGTLTAGHITNLVSTDSRAMCFASEYAVDLISTPTRVIMTMYVAHTMLGHSVFIGVVAIVIVFPLYGLIAAGMSKVRRAALKFTDKRLQHTYELFSCIKLLKMCGLEEKFTKSVKSSRRNEMQMLFGNRVMSFLASILGFCFPFVLVTVVFGTYPIFNKTPISADVAFTGLTLLNNLYSYMFALPFSVNYMMNATVSAKRLRDLFLLDEVQESKHNSGATQKSKNFKPMKKTSKLIQKRCVSWFSRDNDPASQPLLSMTHTAESTQSLPFTEVLSTDIAVSIRNGTFTWDPSLQQRTLRDINIEIPRGKLTIITGSVGSGKSSLLSAILGEILTVSGDIRSFPSIAYTSQTPWIMNKNLRKNILYGSSYIEERYLRVIDSCALRHDINLMPAGEWTEIGERGINLSGGQKQRLNVARAMYADKDIVIMDDPLSALDVHVGEHLFQEGIIKILGGSRKTTILVTHHLQHLRKADYLIVMKDGTVKMQGSPEEVMSQSASFFSEWNKQFISSTGREVTTDIDFTNTPAKSNSEQKNGVLPTQINVKSIPLQDYSKSCKDSALLIKPETYEVGTISWQVYLFYLKSMGLFFIPLIIITLSARVAIEVQQGLLFARWTTTGKEGPLGENENSEFIKHYVGLSIGIVLAAAFNEALPSAGFFRASWSVHNALLRNVIQLPLRFFDVNPLGRVLNRFSTDIVKVDQYMFYVANTLVHTLAIVLVSYVFNAAVNPVFIVLLIPIVAAFIGTFKYYMPAARDIQRIETITLSPILSLFSETLQGLSVIRAFNKKERFHKKALSKIELNNQLNHYFIGTESWILLTLDFLSTALLLVVSFTALLSAIFFGLSGSDVGLLVSYTFRTSLCTKLLIRGTVKFDQAMIAMERTKEFIELPTERYEGIDPDQSWPNYGRINFEQIWARYDSTLEPVLKDITIEIKPGQKVGVCGRTGSGKSSMMLALLRCVDVYKGSILVDGINISKVPLRTLRTRISVIPQDPTLFRGNVRFNLDPDGLKSDADLWKILEMVQMKDAVERMEKGLEEEICEGGGNLSVGQRQLFCIARAYLRDSKIVIMDEATASVDFETDQLLQAVMKKVFNDKTIITIAHRITTITDADLILVMEDGRLVEFGHPADLLLLKEGVFSSLVNATAGTFEGSLSAYLKEEVWEDDQVQLAGQQYNVRNDKLLENVTRLYFWQGNSKVLKENEITFFQRLIIWKQGQRNARAVWNTFSKFHD